MNFTDPRIVYGETWEYDGEYFVNIQITTEYGYGTITQPILESCSREVAEKISLYLHNKLEIIYYKEL